jgi:hypothetical protein
MSVLLVVLLAILSRVLPVALHQQAWNFSLLGGSLLFVGSRLASHSPRRAALKIGGVLAAMAATDYGLTVYGYGFPFHVNAYLLTWAWYGGVILASMGLFRTMSAVRVAAGAVATPTSFFLLSNFVVWVGSGMYAHTMSGLAQCYTMALPFYRNDLVSTGLAAVALFGLPAVATRLAESFRPADHSIAA